MIKIVGMDPAFRNWGAAYALFHKETGSLEFLSLDLHQTKRSNNGLSRSMDDLFSARSLYQFFQSALEGQDVVVSEIPSGTQSSSAAKAYGISMGILSSSNLPLIGVKPLDVKQSSTGNKNATKEEMISWAYGLYPDLNWRFHKRHDELILSGKNEHLADAIGVVHAGIKTEAFKDLFLK